eukprot:356990-Chlamydomonas_euryale.AAC.5
MDDRSGQSPANPPSAPPLPCAQRVTAARAALCRAATRVVSPGLASAARRAAIGCATPPAAPV